MCMDACSHTQPTSYKKGPYLPTHMCDTGKHPGSRAYIPIFFRWRCLQTGAVILMLFYLYLHNILMTLGCKTWQQIWGKLQCEVQCHMQKYCRRHFRFNPFCNSHVPNRGIGASPSVGSQNLRRDKAMGIAWVSNPQISCRRLGCQWDWHLSWGSSHWRMLHFGAASLCCHFPLSSSGPSDLGRLELQSGICVGIAWPRDLWSASSRSSKKRPASRRWVRALFSPKSLPLNARLGSLGFNV